MNVIKNQIDLDSTFKYSYKIAWFLIFFILFSYEKNRESGFAIIRLRRQMRSTIAENVI